jgi:hypothetical protein
MVNLFEVWKSFPHALLPPPGVAFVRPAIARTESDHVHGLTRVLAPAFAIVPYVPSRSAVVSSERTIPLLRPILIPEDDPVNH